MRVLNEADAKRWCEAGDAIVFRDGRPKLSVTEAETVELHLPVPAREAVVFCRSLLFTQDSENGIGGGLLWIWDPHLGSRELNAVGQRNLQLMRRGLGELSSQLRRLLHSYSAKKKTSS